MVAIRDNYFPSDQAGLRPMALWRLAAEQRANRASASPPWSHPPDPEIPPRMASSQFPNMACCCPSLFSNKCRHAEHTAAHSTACCTAQLLSCTQSWYNYAGLFIWPWSNTDPSCCMWLSQCQEDSTTKCIYGVMICLASFPRPTLISNCFSLPQ